ncbi:MAG: sigma-70 family RNA polymerase sigma factor [Acidobacteria bacterium]|nr:sigma-70 family RNA polymerase sigma factor [Acidobacteriota bacterium]
MTNAADDAELMARVQRGDDVALASLYDRHGGRAYALAFAILSNSHDAEDAVARAFAQVWSGRDRYEASQGAFVAWFNTIVRSRSLDLYRSRQRRTRAHDAVGEDPEVNWQFPAPDEVVDRDRARGRVREALNQLPAELSRPLALAYFRGMSHSEIAVALELPLGTVKTRIRAAMRDLRSSLENAAEVGVS